MDATAEVLSPFLPGTNTQYAWDSTSIGYLKQCPRLYQYIMLEGWNAKAESIHLRFGIEYHQALQDYDISRASGIPHNDAVHDVVRALLERTYGWNPDRDERTGKYKNRDTLLRTVIWYLDQFKDDPAKTLIDSDGVPVVERSFRFELDWGPERSRLEGLSGEEVEQDIKYQTQPYLLCGHLDRVVTFNDDIYVMDRKTTTTTPGSYYFNQYEPNNQMSLYTLASQIVFDSPIKGVIIDVAQVLVDSSRFVRGFTYRTPDQLDEFVKDLQYWFNLAEGYAEANYWPMNDTACDKFGGCRFREICSKSPQVRGQFLKSNFEQGEAWNPLKPR